MTIRTHPTRDSWVVVATWLGAERIVFEGTLYGALAFRTHNLIGA